MIAVFVIPEPHEQTLPAMSDIQYLDADGNLAGGWWIAPNCTSPTPNTVIVCVDTSDTMLDIMNNNPDYLYLGELNE